MEVELRSTGVENRIDWPLLRVKASYHWRHRRACELTNPTRFNEIVQLRKLADRDPRIIECSDKLQAKRIAAATLGPAWIVPTRWQGPRLPNVGAFTEPVIVKARHGCNQHAVLRRPPSLAAWAALRWRTDRWLRRPYGTWLDEWGYRDVPRGLLTEPLLHGIGPLPTDYKIFVFGGVATHVQVHVRRETAHHWTLCDRSGRPLACKAERPPLPASLDAMLAAAEELARNFSFARIDFYEVERRPLFGEFCFYPGSGLQRFAEDWMDEELGSLWLAALQ